MSKFSSQIPRLSAIQRSTALLSAVVTALLFWASPELALGCLVGGLLACANLVALGVFVRALFRVAMRRSNPSFWLALAPFKLFILIGVAYLILWRLKLQPLGFAIGISTPFVAAILETGRLAMLNKVRSS